MIQQLSIPNPEKREQLVVNLKGARVAFHEVDQMLDGIIAKLDEKRESRIRPKSNSCP